MQVPYATMRMSSYNDSVSLQGHAIHMRASRGSLVPSRRFQKRSNQDRSPSGSVSTSPVESPVSSPPTSPPDSPPSMRKSSPNNAISQVQPEPDFAALDIEQARIEPSKTSSNHDLQDKVVIVSGGGRGIGLTMAEALYQGGANVHCLDTPESPQEEFVAVQARTDTSRRGTLRYHHVDLHETDALQQCIADIADEHKRIDGLIAAEGGQHAQTLEPRDLIHTAAAQEVSKQMLRYATPGSIVLVASERVSSSAHMSSEAALNQLTHDLTAEWSKSGIRVNSLHSGRTTRPEEFRGPATFLISNASSYMTGTSLLIDGGHTAW